MYKDENILSMVSFAFADKCIQDEMLLWEIENQIREKVARHKEVVDNTPLHLRPTTV